MKDMAEAIAAGTGGKALSHGDAAQPSGRNMGVTHGDALQRLALGLITVFGLSVLVIYAVAYLYAKSIDNDRGHADTTARRITIANSVLDVPANTIRFRRQREAATLSRLDLHFHWPSMSGYTPALAPFFETNGAETAIVYIAVEPRAMSQDMSGRVTTIYPHFFSGPPIDAGNGLVRRSFSSKSAYVAEDLYYEAESPYPFAARCVRESERTATRFCLRDIHIGGDLTITYRFHASLLAEWMVLERAIRDTLAAMILD